ncbi:MAG: hypothetical protein JNK38_17840 [Acidobacteria bacterium]|nr:hypothetical protein [Acidobacteriota bacterium]
MKKTIATLSLMALMLGATTAFAGVTKQDNKGNKPAMTDTATHNKKGKRKGKTKTAKPKQTPATTKPSSK